jgi:arylsulfatase
LQDAGYQTFMAGKWHLGSQDGQRPESHGFDHSFALMQGGASHYADMARMTPVTATQYFEDGQAVAELPPDFYSSDFYTDQMIEYIGGAEDEPFFGYLAYTAPHWPLQAPEAWIEPFEGTYDAGYEVLKDQRIKGLVDAGLFPEDAPANDFKSFGPQRPWDSLTDAQRRTSARSMEIYAGMVANLDWNIGRVIAHLKETGQYDDTVIVFMSDNGAEGGNLRFIWDRYPDEVKGPFYDAIDNSYDNMGKVGSFVYYDAWGQAGVGPFRDFKGAGGQGGVRTYLMVKPAGAAEPMVNDSLVSVMDIAPTLLELAGATHPETVGGAPVLPHQGKSLTPILAGQADAVRGEDDVIGTDLLYNRALRKGDWRIVWNQRPPFKSENWLLFDLANDPAETRDVASEHPEKLAEMLAAWDGYVAQNNIILPQQASSN